MIDYRANGFNDLIHDQQKFDQELHRLEHHKLYVGALRSVDDKSIEFLQMICSVQNFGCTIKPVNGKYLTIPTPNAHGHKAGDFGRYSRGNPTGLFFHIASSSGNPTLARNVNGDLQVVFLLEKQVTIPARGFIDKTVDDCKDIITRIVEDDVTNYWDGSSNYLRTLNRLGRVLSLSLITNIKSWSNPANAQITQANKGKNDPLVDTGDLQKSITWVIEP